MTEQVTSEADNGTDPIDVIESVEVGDYVRFNDRVNPLTVERVRRDGTVKNIEVVGIRGGVYRISARVGRDDGSLQRVSGTNEYGVYTWENMTLNSVEVVSTHELVKGNVYRLNDGDDPESVTYVILTESPPSNRRAWDAVRVHMYKDEVLSINESTFNPFFKKPDVHDGTIEYVGKVHDYYYDSERDSHFNIITINEGNSRTGRDVYVAYQPTNSTEYLPITMFIPTLSDRLEPSSYTEFAN